MPTLHDPIACGAIAARNRMVMAPLTRCRAPGHMPTALMARYYAQRASAGFIITEATMSHAGTCAFGSEPAIHDDAHVPAWKVVTDRVHAAGGRIVLQLWHGGRTCHPLWNAGRVPVAPSAIAVTSNPCRGPSGPVPHALPRALDTAQIQPLIDGFADATRRARDAGFDGVEIHGANGYLIDQFIRDGSNERSDGYGGTAPRRIRLACEVVAAASAAWHPSRVGLRISPLGSSNSMRDSDPVGTFSLLAREVARMGIAYLHVIRGDSLGVQKGDVLTPLRAAFRGPLIAGQGYSPAEAQEAVASGAVDAIAFGRAFLANPDLPERVRLGAALNAPREAFFYLGGEEGYTDYPTLDMARTDHTRESIRR